MVKETLDSNRVVLLHGFLSDAECAVFIRRSEEPHCEIGTVVDIVTKGVRNNERVLVDDQHLAERLFHRAAPWLPELVDQHRLAGFNERWRVY